MKREIITANIEELLTRGVGEFVDPDGEFRKKLEAKISGDYNSDIVIKLGVDPTRPDLHLGHAVVLRKLRQFQDLGCKVIFLIGDFTGLIGDPTGKSKVRPEITFQELEDNMKTYMNQVGNILRTESEVFAWIRNSDWFTGVTDLGFPVGQKVNLNITQDNKEITLPLEANSFAGKALMFEQTRMQKNIAKEVSVVTLRTFLATLRKVTHGRLIQRDMFQDRISEGGELYMHEMMYPVLQGIDSSVLARVFGSCDLEVGGTDQHFNMLMGRDVMKSNNQEPQAVLSFQLLEGLDGSEKMSKSLDNYIGITDEPHDMYGKVMSIPDRLITRYYELCTFTPRDDIAEMGKKLEKEKLHPKDAKMQLAHQITAIYHGEQKADEAEQVFINTFQNKEIPESIQEITIPKSSTLGSIGGILVENDIVKSKTEFRRLISESAITDLDEDVKLLDETIEISKPKNIRIGKKRFLRIRPEE